MGDLPVFTVVGKDQRHADRARSALPIGFERVLEDPGHDRDRPEDVDLQLAHRSAGLPLFVEEIIDTYRASGALAVRDGDVAWSGPAAGLVALSMTSWVQSRLARLNDHACAVLAAAAILDRFDRAAGDAGLGRGPRTMMRHAAPPGRSTLEARRSSPISAALPVTRGLPREID